MPLTIKPVSLDISVEAGTDNTIEFTLKDGTTGAAIDITNDTVTFVAKTAPAGTVKIATKTNTSGQHQTPVSGKTRFKLTKSELALSSAPAPEVWRYEVRRIIGGPGGDEVVYFEGSLTVRSSL